MLDEDLKRRVAQLAQMSRDGTFGSDAKQASGEWDTASPEGLEVFHRIVADFCSKPQNDDDKLIYSSAILFCQLLIVAYRDAKKQDPQVANQFLHSFVSDFEGVTGSCLYSQWETLAQASFALKQSSGNPLLVERQSFDVVRAYNEFLSALLPYLTVTWRTALGTTYSTKSFSQPYAAKLHEFQKLTNGENGAFYLIFRLANPKLRNAIAHSDVWLDKTSSKIRYSDDKSHKTAYEIDLVDFMSHVAVGSHLAQSYIVAIATIVIFESESPAEYARLPPQLRKVLSRSRQDQ